MYTFTQQQALMIKNWRKTYSWRKIADKAAEEWPSLEIIPGHQMEGIEICQCAARALGEETNVEPWC